MRLSGEPLARFGRDGELFFLTPIAARSGDGLPERRAVDLPWKLGTAQGAYDTEKEAA